MIEWLYPLIANPNGFQVIPAAILGATLVIFWGLYLWSKSIFFTLSIIGGLAGATFVSFIIAPLFGYRHFGLSEYWVLIPIFIVSIVGIVMSMVGMYSTLPKSKKK